MGAPVSRALRVPSFAKINLGLEVLHRRRDGYHELRTVFQTIDLHDDIVLRECPRGVVLRCAHPEVPEDRTNLAARAAQALRRHAGIGSGVLIEIEKRVPVARGLGGGSSNAAAVLLGLDRLWGLGLGPAGLQPLARRLGADVPFFLLGGTALGLARGDEVYPLRRQVRAHVVVVDPGRPISTPAVYARLAGRLTPSENSHRIYRFVSSDLGGLDGVQLLANDLERAALEEAPGLARPARRIRKVLVGEGARLVLLSGSGSAWFGIFDSPGPARGACAALAAAGFRTHRARTLSRDQYRGIWARSLESARPGQGQTR